MYCIKVPEDQERSELFKYSGAFLPSYDSVDSRSTAMYGSRGVRRFVVPGYIFSINKEGRAVAVPEKEWQIIEALSDPHPSFINEEGKIIYGPLAGLNDLIKSTEDYKVQIQASLLGATRTYWIRVRSAEEKTESVPENKPIQTKSDSPETDEKPETTNPELSPAELENAALKERITQLEKEIRKLRKTLSELS